jgi:Cof subfamily protein (haloacid dehalogenase superfamily)
VRIRLLALDIDGTLLNSDHRITDKTRSAVQSLAKRDVHIVLASARSPFALLPLLQELGVSEYVVAFGGGMICQIAPDQTMMIIYEQRLSLDAAHTIVHQALAEGISVGWFSNDTWHIAAWDEVLRHEAAIIGNPSLVSDLIAMQQAPHKLQLMVATDIDKLHRIVEVMPPKCVGLFSHPNYLEIFPSGVDKLVGLTHLGRKLAVPLHEMAAIGDGENDIDMLRGVGLGIAMGNANIAVQKSANWVTASNEQDGVAAAINYICEQGLF